MGRWSGFAGAPDSSLAETTVWLLKVTDRRTRAAGTGVPIRLTGTCLVPFLILLCSVDV